MESNVSQLNAWLERIIGHKLIGLFALVHIFEGRENSDKPQAIYLKIERSMDGSLKCDADGESLIYGHSVPNETDLGEYGKEVLKDLSNDEFWSKRTGKVIVGTYSLLAENDVCVGVRLVFENGLFADIANLGDELYTFDAMPQKIVKEERLKFIEISLANE